MGLPQSRSTPQRVWARAEGAVMVDFHQGALRVSGRNLLLAGALSGLLQAPACGFSTGRGAPAVEILEGSGEPIDAVPCVPRLVLRSAEPADVAELWLLEGEVAGSTEEKLLRGEVPESVLERRVPLAVWTAGAEVHLAPTVVLEPATTYTLFVMGRGSPGTVRTSSDACEIWHRWSGTAPESGKGAVYCVAPPPWLLSETVPAAGEVSEPESVELTLEPGGGVAELSNGLFRASDGCIELDYGSSDEHVAHGFVLPPQSLDGRWFEPAPLWAEGLGGAPGEEVVASSDQEGPDADRPEGAVRIVSSGEILEVELLPGLHVLEVASKSGVGKRLRLVRLVEQPEVERLGPLGAGAHELEYMSIRPDGARDHGTSEFEVTPGTAEPVVTEVLANPNGPEPASEWVEIYNPSAEPRSLAGYRLRDAGGTTDLPAVLLPAGGFGLVVTASYVANPDVDVVPDGRAVPIVVESIGKQGLANSGEEILLENPAGKLVSRVPALAGKEGVSVVRTHPLAPDVATSFRAHGAPGASPGSSAAPETEGQ